MTMPEEAAFLDAVRAAPHDDAPRLIYADWLSEQGDEAQVARGEFIRAQIARSALEEWTPDWYSLYLREEKLQQEHLATWEAPYREYRAVIDGYERGLPSRVRLSAASFNKHREAIATATPGWNWISLHGSGGALRRALAEPLPSAVKHIEFRTSGIDTRATLEDSAGIAGSSWLIDAATVSLSGAGLGDDVEPIVSALANVALTTLRTLDLSGNELDDDAAARLAPNPIFQSLHTLDVSSNPLGVAGPMLVSACRSGVLRTLRMGSLDTVDTSALLATPALRELETLHLFNVVLDEAAAPLFSPSAPLSSLRRLSLLNTGLRAANFPAPLPTTGGLFSGGLTHLDLSSNPLGDRALAALADSSLFAGLRVLLLSMTNLTDRGVRALASSSRLTSLRRLHLASNWITGDGEAALGQSPNLPNLLDLQAASRWKPSRSDNDF